MLLYRDELLTFVFVVLSPVFLLGLSLATHQFEHEVFVDGRVAVVDREFKNYKQVSLDGARVIAKDSLLLEGIKNNDGDGAVRILKRYLEDTGLTTLVAVNSSGAAIARAPSSRSGDFVFQTTPWGREVKLGQEALMVGESRNFPMVIVAGVPILESSKVNGGIFGGYILNDEFAGKFKKDHLRDNEQIAFYSVGFGVYGTSFSSGEDDRLFHVLFNSGSDAVRQTNKDLIVGHFKIGPQTFHIGNIDFFDSDGQKVGGMFLLTPAYTAVPVLVQIVAGLLVMILLFRRCWKAHRQSKKIIVATLIGFAVLFIGSLVVSAVRIAGFLYAPALPDQTIYNSIMEFSPSADVFGALRPQTIGIQITTGGEEINAAQATVEYDPTLARVEEILMDKSFCDQQFVIEKEIDNKRGRASVACIKTGGFLADRAVLAELQVQPLRRGTIVLKFADDTSVLANDGLGTDVLREAANGSYQFMDASSGGADGDELPIFAYTHPNPERWYNNATVHIEWLNIGGFEKFRHELDQIPNSIPIIGMVHSGLSADFIVNKDGVYYFHLTPYRANKPLKTSHLRIAVDTTPPSPPEIQLSSSKVQEGEVVRVKLLSSGDKGSGLQKNFYASFDGGMWLPTLPDLHVPFFQRGEHEIAARVFDNAGNYSDSRAIILVE